MGEDNEKNGFLQVIDGPFEKMARGTIKTLTDLGPNPRESKLIEQQVTGKYIPATRNAVLLTLATIPGILLMKDPASVMYFLTIVSSVTGIAWFAMSLKEVQEKFGPFGTELTRDMLEAFLSSLFLAGIVTGYDVASPQIQAIISWMQEAGMDLNSFFKSKTFRAGAALATIGAGVHVVKRLVSAVIKFDANDSLLTGSSNLAKRFYEQSLSSLRNTARILKSEHTIELANFQIAVALSSYYQFFKEINAELPESLTEESLRKLAMSATKDQKKVDNMVIPVLKELLAQYKVFLGQNESLKHKYSFALEAITELEKTYEQGLTPPQSLADASIATAIDTLSDFLEQFQDELRSETPPSTSPTTPQT